MLSVDWNQLRHGALFASGDSNIVQDVVDYTRKSPALKLHNKQTAVFQALKFLEYIYIISHC